MSTLKSDWIVQDLSASRFDARPKLSGRACGMVEVTLKSVRGYEVANYELRTRIVELELRVSSKDGREEADGSLIRLPVRHGGGSGRVLVNQSVWTRTRR